MLSELIKRHKLSIAFLGDIIVFLASMVLVLYVRYGNAEFHAQLSVHLEPFIIVLVLWLIIFYISNLYTYKAFGNILEIARRTSAALIVSFSITITIFYIFSRFFELTPKANLILLTIAFWVLDILWRHVQRKIFIQKKFRSNILMIALSPLTREIAEYINANPQLGYTLHQFRTDELRLAETVQKNFITQIVIDGNLIKDNNVTKILYGIVSKQIEITTLTDFYESLFGCIPLSEIKEDWFIKEITKNKRIYESTKYLVALIFILITLPLTIPLALIVSALVATSSPGPIIYKQTRIGKNDKPFTLYKFRTMRVDRTGPLWTSEDDTRFTVVGRFLHRSHLDEIPQILNVIKRDITFVGPRPERIELAKSYEQIPYYEIRHIIKPGIIGWAQLNFKPSTSIAEAQKKFQFDLYYIKNRSLVLDLFIFLKTARTIFIRNE